ALRWAGNVQAEVRYGRLLFRRRLRGTDVKAPVELPGVGADDSSPEAHRQAQRYRRLAGGCRTTDHAEHLITACRIVAQAHSRTDAQARIFRARRGRGACRLAGRDTAPASRQATASPRPSRPPCRLRWRPK